MGQRVDGILDGKKGNKKQGYVKKNKQTHAQNFITAGVVPLTILSAKDTDNNKKAISCID